jgi:signal transduction histidine kinase
MQSMPGTVSLLYVEDDDSTRPMVTRVLEKNGFKCIVAKNGCEGVDLYRQHSPEIVLSDIRMPDMSGLEMARAIRKHDPQAKFVFMTAVGESKFILEAIDIGVMGYVVKPADLSKLLSAISQCVSSARHQAEVNQKRHQEAVSILAGGLAHDFNNLLQVVLGNVSLAKKYVDPESPAFACFEEAEDIAREARNLGKRLGTLARGACGALQKISLAPNLVNSVQAALAGSSTTASFDLPPDLPQVTVDKTQMEQVFSHLATNAADAMPEGGRLGVSACVRTLPPGCGALLAPGDYVCICFEDSGPGIPPQLLPRIFDPYFTTKSMDFNKGRGLGLSVCQAILSRHGGLVQAESTPGAGATFSVWLPAAGV